MARESNSVGIVSLNRYNRMKLCVTDQAWPQLSRIVRAGHTAIVLLELPEGISRGEAAGVLRQDAEFIGWCRDAGHPQEVLASWLEQIVEGELL
jgi:hypothetical protein